MPQAPLMKNLPLINLPSDNSELIYGITRGCPPVYAREFHSDFEGFFYRLTPVSKPVNKRLVMLDLGQDTHKTQNTSKTPKTSCTSGTTYKTT